MDVKGAKELARRLVERHGRVPEPSPVVTLQARDAAPLFHWVGVEPPAVAAATEATATK
jgi:hypothetical protein